MKRIIIFIKRGSRFLAYGNRYTMVSNIEMIRYIGKISFSKTSECYLFKPSIFSYFNVETLNLINKKLEELNKRVRLI